MGNDSERTGQTGGQTGSVQRDAEGRLIDPATGKPFDDQDKAERELDEAEAITNRETKPTGDDA